MKRAVIFFLVLVTATCAFGEELSPAEAKAFFEQIRSEREELPSVVKNFREEKHLAITEKPVVTEGKIWFQAPDHFRKETRDAGVSFSDGQFLWVHDPGMGFVERYDLSRPGTVRDSLRCILSAVMLRDMEKYFTWTVERTDTGHVVHLQPRRGPLRRSVEKIRVDLNRENRVTRMEIWHSGGDRTVTDYWDEKSVPPDEKRFRPDFPPGTRVVDIRM